MIEFNIFRTLWKKMSIAKKLDIYNNHRKDEDGDMEILPLTIENICSVCCYNGNSPYEMYQSMSSGNITREHKWIIKYDNSDWIFATTDYVIHEIETYYIEDIYNDKDSWERYVNIRNLNQQILYNTILDKCKCWYGKASV